ncbi:hypothetical protein [Sphingorhabdus sp. Alg231-15]|uniref:hypothetical protein n=1 Tax=Sphingorhabdus sp. Alg231-15 TaxID=1922222 RepID=UPI000D54E745
MSDIGPKQSFRKRLSDWFVALDEVIHGSGDDYPAAILQNQSLRITQLEAEIASLKNESRPDDLN